MFWVLSLTFFSFLSSGAQAAYALYEDGQTPYGSKVCASALDDPEGQGACFCENIEKFGTWYGDKFNVKELAYIEPYDGYYVFAWCRLQYWSIYDNNWRDVFVGGRFNAGQKTLVPSCPANTIQQGDSCVTPPNRKKNLGQSCPATPNPIHIGNGNKYLSESDFAGVGFFLSVIRHYNNQGGQRGAFGSNWNVFGSLKINSNTSISVIRPDQKTFNYTLAGTNWTTDADVTHKLVQTASGWQLATPSGVIENYDSNGRLTSVVNLDGQMQSFTYDAAGLLTTVTDPFARSLAFTYNASNSVSTITTPAGVITYAYDTIGNLVSVTYPDGKIKTYLYENTTYPHALTGITDENGDRYATYRYDSAGRADDEDHGGPVDHYTLAYTTDASGNPVSTTVTDPLTTPRTYTFTTILGVVKSTGVSQPGGSGCGAASSATTYDANGNVASRADFNGHQTCYA